jgi:calcineurin-like phosphoesterase family protein
MAVFFTSDTHFGHEAIIGLCERPFASVAEMDEALIEKWNAMIAPEDSVYHLGDFSFRNARPLAEYRRALNGTIHLITGNHDFPLTRDYERQFASVFSILEIGLNGKRIVLCHYPMREWHGSWRGVWHLHGHLHGRLNHEPLGYSLDVGVDSNEYHPWSFEEIDAVFSMRDNPFAGRSPKPVRKTIRAPSQS